MTKGWRNGALLYVIVQSTGFILPTQNNKSSILRQNGDHDESPTEKGQPAESPLDKAMRKARARREIERLTNGPDGVYDREADLKNLIGGISPGLPPDSREAETERRFDKLESSMSRAVDENDFGTAARVRDEIDRMHVDDCGFVLQANTAFYKSFTEKNYDEMKKVWMQCEGVQCIHPSHEPLVGYKDVMESWKGMFDSDVKTFQMNSMVPSNIKLSVKGCTALLTCNEEVYASKFVRGVGKRKELIKKMMATNIFRKQDDKWFMVHHHASWLSDNESKNINIYGKPPKEKKNSDSLNIGSLGGLLGGGFGAGESDGAVRRVFMGNINDLLSGVDGSDKGDSDTGKTIIQVSSEFDDDDDENIDNVEDLDDKRNMKWMNKGKQSVPKDMLRQNCISALRNLSSKGSISSKQKRLLLTDIITCSAKGEFSLVEVAYELLCGEGDDKDAAEEEFADQCRLFATSLSESQSSS